MILFLLLAYTLGAMWSYQRIVWLIRREFPTLSFTRFDQIMSAIFAVIWPVGYPVLFLLSSEHKEIYPPLDPRE